VWLFSISYKFLLQPLAYFPQSGVLQFLIPLTLVTLSKWKKFASNFELPACIFSQFTESLSIKLQ
jgi:hypothetical protein